MTPVARPPDGERELRHVEGEPCRFFDGIGAKPYCTFHGGWWVYGYCDAAPLRAVSVAPDWMLAGRAGQGEREATGLRDVEP